MAGPSRRGMSIPRVWSHDTSRWRRTRRRCARGLAARCIRQDQAAEKGMTRKARRCRVERGQWLDAARGVLVIAGTPAMASEAHGRSAVESRRRVALISRGRCMDSTASRRVSCTERCPRTLPGSTGVLSPPGIGARRDDLTIVDQIPVTNVARTLCDLARWSRPSGRAGIGRRTAAWLQPTMDRGDARGGDHARANGSGVLAPRPRDRTGPDVFPTACSSGSSSACFAMVDFPSWFASIQCSTTPAR